MGAVACTHQNDHRCWATDNGDFTGALGPLQKRLQMNPHHTGLQQRTMRLCGRAEMTWRHLLAGPS